MRCGATQWYRDFSEHEVATKAEPALAWLRNTVMRVLPASAKWNFEVLSGQEEASLEWISVKHAMAIEFAEEPPIAALAAAGSVERAWTGPAATARTTSRQVALKEGIALVETRIDGWRTAHGVHYRPPVPYGNRSIPFRYPIRIIYSAASSSPSPPA